MTNVQLKHDLAPNRVLDLAELHQPFWQSTLHELEALARQNELLYLHPSKRWEYPWALDRAALAPSSTVLDAGCGASVFPWYLARHGYRVTACDTKLQSHEIAGARKPARIRADITDLPAASQTYDAVFCISVIEHLPREQMSRALTEMRRVLTPGGKLLLTTDYYRDAGERIWYVGPGDSFAVEWNVFDERLLREIILTAPGFSILGDIDLRVDWKKTSEQMRRYHGYPYTSVGIALERQG